MESRHITSRQTEKEKLERVTDFHFLSFKINTDRNCSHEIKRHLLLRRKAVINLDSVLKSREITLPTNVHTVKAVVSPVVTDSCESWTVMKAKHQRIDGVWTVVLEKTPESFLDCKEIKPVNLKGNQPWILFGRTDAKAEAPVFWSSDVNSWLIGKVRYWKRLRAKGKESVRGWNGWMASPMWWTWTWANFRRWWGTGRPGVLQSMGLQSQTGLGDWTAQQQIDTVET